ncbi:54S ribosomal protein L4 mitochondrial [Mycoblastus sanguinarius]|nr:54S ribosomal protein L4 mitochondrial [Mycoblastus sanguinarius]
MPGHSGFRYALILRKLVPSDHPPVFLAPLLASSPQPPHQRLQFSTATALSARYKKRRDGNPNRGVSALRRTGLKFPNAMSREPLPKPVLDPERRSKVQADPNHGLWGFFHKDRKALTTPEEDYAFGRSWTVEELRHKSWEDLHSLWYICCKERNRLATEKYERRRLRLDVGDGEAHEREMKIRRTQQRIKHTLTERWYAWEDAWKVAHKDPEVDLNAEPDTLAYRPQIHEQEEPEAEVEDPPRAASAA